MKDFYYFLTIFICAVISFVGGYKFEKPKTYKRGWNEGANNAVGWLAIALAQIGFQGEQLQNILTLIAENLNAIKDGHADDPGTTKKGGDPKQ